MYTSSRLSDITERKSLRAGNLIGYSSSDHIDMIVGQHLDSETIWAFLFKQQII